MANPLKVLTDLIVSGSTNLSGALDGKSTATFADKLTVKANGAEITGTLKASDKITGNNGLEITSGDATLQKLTVSGQLTASNGAAITGDMKASGAVKSGNGYVQGSASGVTITDDGKIFTNNFMSASAVTLTGKMVAASADISGQMSASTVVGDGSGLKNLSYANISGAQAAVRGELSATEGVKYNSTTGVFALTESVAGAGLGFAAGVLGVGAGTGITVNAGDVQLKNAGAFSGNKLLKWDASNSQLVDSDISEDGTKISLSKPVTSSAGISATAFIGDGAQVSNLTYGNITGIQTAVRGEFMAKEGIAYSAGTSSIDQTSLSNSKDYLSLWDHTNQRFSSSILVKDPSSALVTVEGNLTINGNLFVTGATTTVATENLLVKDPVIVVGSGSNAAGKDLGLIFGSTAQQAFIWDHDSSRFQIGATSETGADDEITLSAYADFEAKDVYAANLSASAAIKAPAITASVGASVGTLNASGLSTLAAVTASSLEVSGDANFKGAVTLGDAAADVITVTGQMSASAGISMADGQAFKLAGTAAVLKAEHEIMGFPATGSQLYYGNDAAYVFVADVDSGSGQGTAIKGDVVVVSAGQFGFDAKSDGSMALSASDTLELKSDSLVQLTAPQFDVNAETHINSDVYVGGALQLTSGDHSGSFSIITGSTWSNDGAQLNLSSALKQLDAAIAGANSATVSPTEYYGVRASVSARKKGASDDIVVNFAGAGADGSGSTYNKAAITGLSSSVSAADLLDSVLPFASFDVAVQSAAGAMWTNDLVSVQVEAVESGGKWYPKFTVSAPALAQDGYVRLIVVNEKANVIS
jgi:hypothetical protein